MVFNIPVAPGAPQVYSYKPLLAESAEIRLLALEPGRWEDQIRCRLHYTALTDEIQYVALSYTWGNPTNNSQILLHNSPWLVTKNLEVALRYLRREADERILWIDALCINQADYDERAQQVLRSFKIYTSAADVLIWVGEPECDGYAALDIIDEFSKKTSSMEALPDWTGMDDSMLLDAGLHPTDTNWDLLFTFFERPYWSRVWVIKELAACSISPKRGQILCGARSVSRRAFEDFCQVPMWMANAGGRLLKGAFRDVFLQLMSRRPLPAMRMRSVQSQLDASKLDDLDAEKLGWLVRFGTSYQASDTRDKIYAFLGLAPHLDLMVPDYKKPLALVQTEFARALIQTDKTLRSLARNRVVLDDSAPSWAFSLTDHLDSVSMHWFGQRATGPVRTIPFQDVVFRDNNKTARVTGLEVAVIERSIGPFSAKDMLRFSTNSDDIEKEAAFERLDGDISELKALASKLGGKKIENFWRALVMDTDFRQSDNPIRPAPSDFSRQFRLWAGVSQVAQGVDDEEDYADGGFVYNLYDSVADRCFIETDTGCFGIGPYHARMGDVIVAMSGAVRFAALRPGEDSYEFLGDAYLQETPSKRDIWWEGDIEPPIKAFSIR